MSSIVLVIFNLILFAMLVLAWQLWRQSVPKRRKKVVADAADWPSSPGTSGGALAHAAPQAAQSGAVMTAQAPAMHAATAPAFDPPTSHVYAAASASPAPSFAAPVDSMPPAQGSMPPAPAPVPPAPAPVPPSQGAAPLPSVGHISDDDLARLLDVPTTGDAWLAPAAAPVAPAATTPQMPVGNGASAQPTSLFAVPSPPDGGPAVSSLAPPVAQTGAGTLGDDVSRQVRQLLGTSAPAMSPMATNGNLAVSPLAVTDTPPAPSVMNAPAPSLTEELHAVPASNTGTDNLRLDITGRPVDDIMLSLANRLTGMGYSAQATPAGDTLFVRNAHETIRIAVSAQASPSTDANGNPFPGRADVQVIGGQLQETTEAVLFELLDQGFQLRWAVAGELVLSSFDGALARVNVNPTPSV